MGGIDFRKIINTAGNIQEIGNTVQSYWETARLILIIFAIMFVVMFIMQLWTFNMIRKKL